MKQKKRIHIAHYFFKNQNDNIVTRADTKKTHKAIIR